MSNKKTNAADARRMSSGTTEGSYDVGACCLCHSSFDFSDRAAFFRKDREEDYINDGDDGNSSKARNDDKQRANTDHLNTTEVKEATNTELSEKKLDHSASLQHNGENIDTTTTSNGQKVAQNNGKKPENNTDEKRECPELDTKNNENKECFSNATTPNSKAGVTIQVHEHQNKDEKDLHDDEDSSYFFRRKDPYLPESLYDPENALVYCDSCDRLFHQKCHFVPLLQVPRGEWHCLICTSNTVSGSIKLEPKHSSNKTTNKKNRTKGKASSFVYSTNIFKSPPVEAVREQELAWEADPRVIAAKSDLLHQWTSMRILKSSNEYRLVNSKLKRLMLVPLGNISSAQTALTTLTSTKQNRQLCYSVDTEKPSQELLDNMVKFYTSKFKLKCQIHNINSIREAAPTYNQWHGLVNWVQENIEKNADFIQRIIFPFGMNHERRWEPRTSEFQDMLNNETEVEYRNEISKSNTQIPEEIILHMGLSSCMEGSPKLKNKEVQSRIKKEEIESARSASSSSDHFSLDQLICSQCLSGHASDENDLILCDGRGCFRAYHMKCVNPAITKDQIEQNESWFCPWCSAVADWMHEVQCHWHGAKWEERKLGYTPEKDTQTDKNSYASRSTSMQSCESWDDVNDVFPEADWEYETVLKLKAGQNSSDTKKLLAQVLGWDGNDSMNDEEDDNIDNDGNFDLYSYEMERQFQRKDQKNEKNQADETDGSISTSTHSSQVTLVEMSSVELEIASDELNALSEIDSDDNSDGSSQKSGTNSFTRRRSRRLRKQEGAASVSSNSNNDDPGKMNVKNIMYGKRRRNFVDYRKLNDALFGDWDAEEAAKMDGGDDFELNASKKLKNEVTKKSSSQLKFPTKRMVRSKKHKVGNDCDEKAEEKHRKRPRTSMQFKSKSKSKVGNAESALHVKAAETTKMKGLAKATSKQKNKFHNLRSNSKQKSQTVKPAPESTSSRRAKQNTVATKSVPKTLSIEQNTSFTATGASTRQKRKASKIESPQNISKNRQSDRKNRSGKKAGNA